MDHRYPWQPGSATGVGSYPGTNFAETLRMVLHELPDLPHLPELPARGLGADMIARGAGLLADMPVDQQPSGWRLVDRPGRDSSRIRDFLERDLDMLEELAGEYAGPFKIQSAGPWTLAANLELHYGDKVLADPGAARDLAASLAEGLSRHVANVRRRLPNATILLQLDEPSLPAVLAARVRTASGFGMLRSVEASTAETALAEVIKASGAPVIVHSCAPNVPFALLHGAGAVAAAVDFTLLDLTKAKTLDALGGVIDSGLGIWAGVVPSTDASLSDRAGTVSPVRTLWNRLGFAPERLADAVVVTPSCGLAGASPAYARAALTHSREAARALVDDPEG